MYQLFSVIISFLLIPIFIKRKIRLSYTLLIIAALLGVISGIGLVAIKDSITNLVMDNSSLETIVTVFMVSILGGLMKHYGILDLIVSTMVSVIRNKKIILMTIPALMGLLVVPGGAMLSAPFVNKIGEDLDIPPSRRAAINLIFRHIAMFILPYSTPILLVLASIPQIDYPRLILYNLIFVIIIIVSGYNILLKDIKNIKVEKTSSKENFWENILNLLIYLSPIYIAVVLNGVIGWPFYVTLIASILIVYLLSDKKEFLLITYKSISWEILLSIIGVLIIKNMILNMDELLLFFNNIFDTNSSFLSIFVVFFISSIFFSFITGNNMGALAIVLPMLYQLNVNEGILYIYAYSIYVSSFIGYFFSPLHLCQVFTLNIMNVSAGKLYEDYKIYATLILALFLLSVFVLKIIT